MSASLNIEKVKDLEKFFRYIKSKNSYVFEHKVYIYKILNIDFEHEDVEYLEQILDFAKEHKLVYTFRYIAKKILKILEDKKNDKDSKILEDILNKDNLTEEKIKSMYKNIYSQKLSERVKRWFRYKYFSFVGVEPYYIFMFSLLFIAVSTAWSFYLNYFLTR